MLIIQCSGGTDLCMHYKAYVRHPHMLHTTSFTQSNEFKSLHEESLMAIYCYRLRHAVYCKGCIGHLTSLHWFISFWQSCILWFISSSFKHLQVLKQPQWERFLKNFFGIIDRDVHLQKCSDRWKWPPFNAVFEGFFLCLCAEVKLLWKMECWWTRLLKIGGKHW